MPKIALLIVSFLCTHVCAKDITQQVKVNTCFDEEIANACSGKCGNRGYSRLDSVNIEQSQPGFYKVLAKATIEYHDHRGPSKLMGIEIGGGVGIKHTVKDTALGTLNASTCFMTVDKIEVVGDVLGIANEVKKEQGKRHHLINCQQYI